MQPNQLTDILRKVAAGKLKPAAAYEKLRALPFVETADAVLDRHRHVRTGFPEAVYGAGKTGAQILRICEKLLAHNPGRSVLVTRIADPAATALQKRFGRAADHDALARTVILHPPKTLSADPPKVVTPGGVAIVCAGTSDLNVAREAFQTLRSVGIGAALIHDVGVAGLHRLLARLEALDHAGVIIAVAGMDGALPSVLAGLVPCPVIACPTSVGYGAGMGGLAPLLTMLNSCAPGVTVVNIDNGFGAAVSAVRCLRETEHRKNRKNRNHQVARTTRSLRLKPKKKANRPS